jgi:hypothetical protein
MLFRCFRLETNECILGDIGAIIVVQQISLLCPDVISALYLRNCGTLIIYITQILLSSALFEVVKLCLIISLAGMTKDIDRGFVSALGSCSAIARLDLSFNDLGTDLVLAILGTQSIGFITYYSLFVV